MTPHLFYGVLEQITNTRDLNTTQKLQPNFLGITGEILAAAHSNTSIQPYTQLFSISCSLRCWR